MVHRKTAKTQQHTNSYFFNKSNKLDTCNIHKNIQCVNISIIF